MQQLVQQLTVDCQVYHKVKTSFTWFLWSTTQDNYKVSVRTVFILSCIQIFLGEVKASAWLRSSYHQQLFQTIEEFKLYQVLCTLLTRAKKV